MIEKFCKDPNFLMNVFETMRDGLMIVDKEVKFCSLTAPQRRLPVSKRDNRAGVQHP
jgi:hypothetical protein